MLRGRGTPSALQQHQQGVSLVEVVVAMALMVLLMAVAAPSVQQWVADLKVRAVAESMRSGLDRARMEALRRNTPVGFWLVEDSTSSQPGAACAQSASSQHWVVSVNPPDKACHEDPSPTDGIRLAHRSEGRAVDASVQVRALDGNGNAARRVIFTPLGQVQGMDMLRTINVSARNGKGRALRVVVTLGGGVRSCEPDAPATDPRSCI